MLRLLSIASKSKRYWILNLNIEPEYLTPYIPLGIVPVQSKTAEKPELGRAITQALHLSGPESHGVISGNGYSVVWAYGHFLRLIDPAKDARYAK